MTPPTSAPIAPTAAPAAEGVQFRAYGYLGEAHPAEQGFRSTSPTPELGEGFETAMLADQYVRGLCDAHEHLAPGAFCTADIVAVGDPIPTFASVEGADWNEDPTWWDRAATTPHQSTALSSAPAQGREESGAGEEAAPDAAALQQDNQRLTEEVKRLRALVVDAYCEGVSDADVSFATWHDSKAKAALDLLGTA